MRSVRHLTPECTQERQRLEVTTVSVFRQSASRGNAGPVILANAVAGASGDSLRARAPAGFGAVTLPEFSQRPGPSMPLCAPTPSSQYGPIVAFGREMCPPCPSVPLYAPLGTA